MSVIVGSLFLIVGCGNEKVTDNGGTNGLTYTNKYECSRLEKYTTQQVYYRTKKDHKNDEDSGKDALMTYNYLVDYDMEEQKKYFEDECKTKDKDTYKSCIVSLSDKTITVTLEVNLDSADGKESFSGATLDLVKENYADSPYTCKQ